MSWFIEASSKEGFRKKIENEIKEDKHDKVLKTVLSLHLNTAEQLPVPDGKLLHITSTGHVDKENVICNLSIRSVDA